MVPSTPNTSCVCVRFCNGFPHLYSQFPEVIFSSDYKEGDVVGNFLFKAGKVEQRAPQPAPIWVGNQKNHICPKFPTFFPGDSWINSNGIFSSSDNGILRVRVLDQILVCNVNWDGPAPPPQIWSNICSDLLLLVERGGKWTTSSLLKPSFFFFSNENGPFQLLSVPSPSKNPLVEFSRLLKKPNCLMIPMLPNIFSDFPARLAEPKKTIQTMATINLKITLNCRTECDGFLPNFLIQMGLQGNSKKVNDFGLHR